MNPIVQNLTKLLANVTLKFLSWNMANALIYFAEKNLSRKSINVFENTYND